MIDDETNGLLKNLFLAYQGYGGANHKAVKSRSSDSVMAKFYRCGASHIFENPKVSVMSGRLLTCQGDIEK